MNEKNPNCHKQETFNSHCSDVTNKTVDAPSKDDKYLDNKCSVELLLAIY